MVTIIIPVYNGERYLDNMFNTLHNLYYEDWEALFIDDGSFDNSASVIKEMADKDHRIKYFYKENGGIASARNYGLDRAKGDLISFFDQDDTVEPQLYNVVLNEIGDADFIKFEAERKTIEKVERIGRSDKYTEEVNVINNTEDKKDRKVINDENRVSIAGRVQVISSKDEAWPYYIWDATMRGLAPEYKGRVCSVAAGIWSVMFKTEFLKRNNIRFRKFLDYEDDLVFMIDVMKYADSFVYIDIPLYIYNFNPLSESNNRIKKDRYIDDFYDKFCLFSDFMLGSVENTGLDEKYSERFKRELQKSCLLWNLSNETGRGIEGRRVKDSVLNVKKAVKGEYKRGMMKNLNKDTLDISTYGATGVKKSYYAFRDRFLTFLMLGRMYMPAVILNKYLIHGRWHW